MGFSLRQIEILRAVARMGSITDAARFLDISQPSISGTLKQCARSAGFPLFRRVQGRFTTTAEALALLPELDRVIEDVAKVDALASELRHGNLGSVRVAATPAIAISLLPAVIKSFRASHAGVRITVDSILSMSVVDAVSEGRADLGLVMSPEQVRGVKVTGLWSSELICIAPLGHPMTRFKVATPEALAKYPFVSFNRTLPLGALIDDAFRSRGVHRKISVEVGPSSMACALVASGAGCAVVDPFAVAHYTQWPIRLLRFAPRTRIAAQLLVHGARPLSPAAEAFVDTMRPVVSVLSRVPVTKPQTRTSQGSK